VPDTPPADLGEHFGHLARPPRCPLGANAIRCVHNGDAVVAPSTTRRLIGRFMPHLPAVDGLPPEGPAALDELTAREREVLAEVGSGLSNTEIAAVLHISEATVKTHVSHVMAKLGVRDRIQVVVYAYETGLIRPQGTWPTER
jgi:DNA-binding NarL/FixJ family response regulator